MAALHNTRLKLQPRLVPRATATTPPRCWCVEAAAEAAVLSRSMHAHCICVRPGPSCRHTVTVVQCGGCCVAQSTCQFQIVHPKDQHPPARWIRGEAVPVLRARPGAGSHRCNLRNSCKAPIWAFMRDRCVATIVRSALRTCADRPLEVARAARTSKFYKDVETRASAIAASVRTAAVYFGLALPCQARAHERTLGAPTTSCKKRVLQQAGERRAALSRKAVSLTVGLLMPSAPLPLLSTMLAVWSCGASAILLPNSSAASSAVAAEGVCASTEDAAVTFNSNGMTLVAYSPDSLAERRLGGSVRGCRCSPESMRPSSLLERDMLERQAAAAFLRHWEHYISQSGCRLLLASPEVAPVAARLSAKLSVPLCIIRHHEETRPRRGPAAGRSATEKEPGSSGVSMYLRQVPHDSRKSSANVTRWKAVKEQNITQTFSEYTASAAESESRSAAMPAMLFYENAGIHSPRAVMYTHDALKGQVLRNKQLLGLTSADAVLLLDCGLPAQCWSLWGCMKPSETFHACEGLWTRDRMTCAPKGLLTVILPAFAAGAAVSILRPSVTDRIEGLGTSSLRIQRPMLVLPNHHSLHYAGGRHGLAAKSSPGLVAEVQGHPSPPPTQIGVQLWRLLASMQARMPRGEGPDDKDAVTRSELRLDDPMRRQIENGGVSLLAMDLVTASAMLAALEVKREGVTHAALPNTVDDERAGATAEDAAVARLQHGKGSTSTLASALTMQEKRMLSSDCARGYLEKSENLRLVCICTDEEDLGGYNSNARSGTAHRSADALRTINKVVHGWQELLPPRVRILHLCTLTQVGLLLWDDGQRTQPPTHFAFARTTSSQNGYKASDEALEGTAPHDVNVEVDSETGFLKIRSPHGASGYYNRPRSTAEAFSNSGEFQSSLRGQVVADGDHSGRTARQSPAANQRIILHGSHRPASSSRVPLLYRLLKRLTKGPKMESHIEGYVKKIPITGKEWTNFHAPKKHRKMLFR